MTLFPRLIVCLVPAFCLLFSGAGLSQAFFQYVKEPQKPPAETLREPTRDPIGTVDPAEDEDEDDYEELEQNSSAVEIDQALRQAERGSPLLSKEDLRRFDIPIVFNDAVDYFIRVFTVQKRKVFVTWLKRAKRYAPTIRRILREHGLPEDLVYLAMIESGFNPKAYSPMKACGPWQFIYETGERYGLRVSHWVDERRDPEKSTVAAARYLKDLFNQFGCWYLAAAGYNAGERRIERAIAKHETNDFWELRKFNTLPRETREYIPQLIAAAIIAKDPEKFGLTDIPFDAPVPSFSCKVPGGTPLEAIAKAARLDVITVRSLNPELIRGITPPDVESYSLRLPEGVERTDFTTRLKAALEDGCRVSGVTRYTMKRRDSIARVAKRYGVSQADLMLVNAYGDDFRARPGTVLYIPRFERDGGTKVAESERGFEEKEAKPVLSASSKGSSRPRGSRELDNAKRTETLLYSARGDKRDAAVLKEPKVAKADRVEPGKRITLAAGPTKLGTGAVRENTSKPPRNKIFHLVRKGESLSDISDRYGTDVETLKRVNKLTKDRITPNMRLAVAGITRPVGADEKANKPGAGQARPVKYYHVVKRGETLADISEKYSINVASLRKWNGLGKSGVRPGMRLRIANQ